MIWTYYTRNVRSRTSALPCAGLGLLLAFGCADDTTADAPPGPDSGAPQDSDAGEGGSHEADAGPWLDCQPLTPNACESFPLGCPNLEAGREELSNRCDPFGESPSREGTACGFKVLLSSSGFSQTDLLFYDATSNELVGVWTMEEETRNTSCAGQVPRACALQHGPSLEEPVTDWCADFEGDAGADAGNGDAGNDTLDADAGAGADAGTG